MPRPSTMFSMQSLNGGTVINIPNPDKASGSNLIATLVNSGRNANAVVVAHHDEAHHLVVGKPERDALLRENV